MKQIEIKQMDVADIIPYELNPRINDLAVGVVADSIREFGFKNPIVVDKENVIIVGHTRLRAAQRLGYDTVPVIVADDLTPDQVKAFRIMDNKSSEFAEWDYLKLLGEIKDLEASDYDITLTGFDDVELGNIIDDIEGKEDKKKDQPEIEFTDELLEEHQYVVLYFDNTMDWQVAKEVLGIKPVHALDSKEGYKRAGVGRVIKGSPIVARLQSADDGREF